MSVSFVRVDDRMIHGQTCTRWALEYPCDGLVAVNDLAANNSVLKAAYKSASGKKTFVWTMDEWKVKCQKVLDSKDRKPLLLGPAMTGQELRSLETISLLPRKRLRLWKILCRKAIV